MAPPLWPISLDPEITQHLWAAGEAAAALAVAALVGKPTSHLVERLALPLSNRAWAFMARRTVFWLIMSAGTAAALRAFGVDLGVLVGAAGVATVAIGFAAQTSTSNLISGLFMMLERSLAVGDVVELEGTTGEVISIDLLSVKLRTFDNLLVRIPNEALVKGKLTNLSRFPIRRIDLPMRFPLEQPLDPVSDTLLAIVNEEPLVLQEPAPQVMLRGFAEGTVDVQLSCWVASDRYIVVRSQLTLLILQGLQRAGLTLSAPRRELLTISAPQIPTPTAPTP